MASNIDASVRDAVTAARLAAGNGGLISNSIDNSLQEIVNAGAPLPASYLANAERKLQAILSAPAIPGHAVKPENTGAKALTEYRDALKDYAKQAGTNQDTFDSSHRIDYVGNALSNLGTVVGDAFNDLSNRAPGLPRP